MSDALATSCLAAGTCLFLQTAAEKLQEEGFLSLWKAYKVAALFPDERNLEVTFVFPRRPVSPESGASLIIE